MKWMGVYAPLLSGIPNSGLPGCLNAHWFLSLDDAREKIESRRCDYNHFRPHSSLGNAAPVKFAEAFRVDSNTPISQS